MSNMNTHRMSAAELIDRNSIPEPNSGCWLWIGQTNSWGYGRLGRHWHERAVHRLSFITHKGPIPLGKILRHSCDVACCVNPDHLRIGTHAENSRDAVERHRNVAQHGEEQVHAKLTWAAADEIRSQPRSAIATLAKQYGVSRRAISFVMEGKTWSRG